MMNILKSKIAIIAIISVVSITGIGFFAYTKLSKKEVIQTVGAQTNKLVGIEEEKVEEVKEQVIAVRKDTTPDNPQEVEDDGEEETVKYKGKEVKVPKSKVAAVNSSEDAERNKKTGGASVSQDQAANMFENVGQKSMGIDVSAHQGKINWAQVRQSGVEFAMIRCGFRGQTSGGIYEDAYFKTNVAGATANGVKVGIYFYSTAVNENEALEEAIWVTKKISTYRITYPVVYDFEDFGAYRCANVGGAQATSNALTFLNFVKSNGYEPMMYANKSDITNRMSRGSFGCKFWLAHYTSQTDYAGNYNMWQYTSKGSVPGISGNVDMDIAYFNYGTTAAPMHTHDSKDLVKGSLKEATCSKAGSKVLRCSCGETKTEEIPKLAHKYGEWKIVEEATTEKEGLKERVCTVCSAKDTQKIAKLKPVENTSNTTNTTPSINPPTHEHKFTVEKSREDATCAKPGKIVYKCTECDKTKEEIIPATGKHDYDGGESCKVCGEKNPDYVKPTPTQNPPAPSENPPEVPEQAESKTE